MRGGRITQVEADRYLMRQPGRVCAQTPDRSTTNGREIPIHLTRAGLTHAPALIRAASPWLRRGAALRWTAQTPQEATLFSRFGSTLAATNSIRRSVKVAG